MIIAIPTADKKLCLHFGHCQEFIFFDVDEKNKTINSKTAKVPPPHEPGVLPEWIASQGAKFVISGGMGSRAQDLFRQNNITVITGAPADDPEKIIKNFLNNTLITGNNTCDH